MHHQVKAPVGKIRSLTGKVASYVISFAPPERDYAEIGECSGHIASQHPRSPGEKHRRAFTVFLVVHDAKLLNSFHSCPTPEAEKEHSTLRQRLFYAHKIEFIKTALCLYAVIAIVSAGSPSCT